MKIKFKKSKRKYKELKNQLLTAHEYHLSVWFSSVQETYKTKTCLLMTAARSHELFAVLSCDVVLPVSPVLTVFLLLDSAWTSSPGEEVLGSNCQWKYQIYSIEGKIALKITSSMAIICIATIKCQWSTTVILSPLFSSLLFQTALTYCWSETENPKPWLRERKAH